MKKRAPALFLLTIFGLSLAQSPAIPYEELRQQAESFYAEGSYQRAQELYEQAERLTLPTGETRCVSPQYGRAVQFQLAQSTLIR